MYSARNIIVCIMKHSQLSIIYIQPMSQFANVICYGLYYMVVDTLTLLRQ